jgi:hypothetical protein
MENSMAILRRFVSCGALAVVGALAASCAGSDSGSAPAATELAGSDKGATESVAVSVPLAVRQLVDVPGPDHVGVTTITIADVSRERTLTVHVWFPIDDPGTAANAVYDGSGVSSYPSPVERGHRDGRMRAHFGAHSANSTATTGGDDGNRTHVQGFAGSLPRARYTCSEGMD